MLIYNDVVQPSRIPVPFAEQHKERGHEQYADDKGVKEHGGDEEKRHLVQDANVRGEETAVGDAHDDTRGGDDAKAARETGAHGVDLAEPERAELQNSREEEAVVVE